MTFNKGFLIAVLSLACFAFSSPVMADEKSMMPTGNTQSSTQSNTQSTGGTNPGVQRIEQKVDVKNLPKNLTNIVPRDGDPFILAVGETKLLTASRPLKCLEPKVLDFNDVKLRLPSSDLITYSDGGGNHERFSGKCGGNVPARAILATGVKKGSQQLLVLGANLTVIVK
jgi:hypothetical protein